MNEREVELRDALLTALKEMSTVKLVDAGDGLEKFQLYLGDNLAYESDPMVVKDFVECVNSGR